jgi:superoxide dismutase, Fe-Mn family
MKYEEKKFNLGTLSGISEKTISEHLKLYAGYVKHTNLILEKVSGLISNSETQYSGQEMQRRFGFEFNGMKYHEIYFSLLENGKSDLPEASELRMAIEKQWGSFDTWFTEFKKITLTRGPGWAVLCFDNNTGTLLNSWVDEHHIGVLNSVKPILVLDMWEHAYYLDYTPAEKIKYIESFFNNINWSVAELFFLNAK